MGVVAHSAVGAELGVWAQARGPAVGAVSESTALAAP